MKKLFLLPVIIVALLLLQSCSKSDPDCYTFTTISSTSYSPPQPGDPKSTYSRFDKCGITESEALNIANSRYSIDTLIFFGAIIITTEITFFKKK